MNRRDMIIVAALINAGLLVMLFVSALKQNVYPLASSADVKSSKTETTMARKEIQLTKAPLDQMDKILSDMTPSHVVEKSVSPAFEKTIQESQISQANAKALQAQAAQASKVAQAHVNSVKEVAKVQPAKQEKKEESVIAKVDYSQDLAKIVVKKGDVLEKIARQHGTTTDAIMQLNDLKGSALRIGQVLYLPKDVSKKEAPSPIKAQASSNDEQFYIVKNGDNLWKIAIENHVKIDDLLKLNQLNEKKAKALRPGDRLRIR